MGTRNVGEVCCDARPRLGNAHCLLLHNFVNRGAVTFIHLVELVDAADAVISEYKCTTF